MPSLPLSLKNREVKQTNKTNKQEQIKTNRKKKTKKKHGKQIHR